MRIIIVLSWCWYTSIVTCFLTKTNYKLRTHIKLSKEEPEAAIENELMKLRAKREAILNKKKKTPPKELDITGQSAGGLASLPPRPKEFRKMEEKYSSNKKAAPTKPTKVSAKDYQIDYEDENELHIPNRIGFSTKNMPNFQVFETLVNGGISFVDTSEQNCAKVGSWSERVPHFPLLALQKKNRWSSTTKTLLQSCSIMETSGIELYQIPFPLLKNPYKEVTTWINKGYCNHVGIQNIRSSRSLQSLTKKTTISSAQFEFSLTQRRHLRLVQRCKQLGIIPIARSPFDHGLATGVYTASNPSGGKGSKIKYPFKVLEPLINLQDAQKKVATKVYERLEQTFLSEREARLQKFKSSNPFAKDITSAQVAINYVVAKGAVPIPSVRSVEEAQELLGCLGWGLLPEEVALLDDAAEQIF